jgi:TraM recognition site of TraD and TraG
LIIESVLNKASALTLNPQLRACLGAKTNALDFRHIMDAGKILIINLGNCDDETRRLIGNLVTTGIEQAATSRAEDRRHFYLYLDEFQDFCANDGGSKTLAQILSECRKYNLHIHLAHQTLGQIQNRVETALGNVGIKVVFGLDYEDAQVMARKLFVDYVGTVKWETATATIQRLPRRTALVKVRNRRLVRMKTTPIKPYRYGAARLAEITTSLSKTLGIPIRHEQLPYVPKKREALDDWERVTPEAPTPRPVSTGSLGQMSRPL